MAGESSSIGAMVPSVKSEFGDGGGESQQPQQQVVAAPEPGAGGNQEVVMMEIDRDMMCPICMQMIKDAFLTCCGHSFCYMCIMTHLKHKSDCPCCAHFLTPSQLYPNFLLNKVRFVLLSQFICLFTYFF